MKWLKQFIKLIFGARTDYAAIAHEDTKRQLQNLTSELVYLNSILSKKSVRVELKRRMELKSGKASI